MAGKEKSLPLVEDIIPQLEAGAGEKVYHEYVIVKTICSSAVGYEHFFGRMMRSVPDSALSLSFLDFLGKPLAIDFSFRRNLFQGKQVKDKTSYVEEIVSAELGDALRGLTASCAATFRSTPSPLEERVREIARKHGVTLTEENASLVSSFLKTGFDEPAVAKMVASLAIENRPPWGGKVLEIADAVESYNSVKQALIKSAIVDTREEYLRKTEELADQGKFSSEHSFRQNELFDRVYGLLRNDDFFSLLFRDAEPFTLYSSEYGLGYNSTKYIKQVDIPRVINLAERYKYLLLSSERRLLMALESLKEEESLSNFDVSTFFQEAEKFKAECTQPYRRTLQDRFVEHSRIGEPCYTANMIKNCFRKRGPAAQQIRDYARQEGRLVRPEEYGIPTREKDTLYIPKSAVVRLIETHNLPLTVEQLEKAYGF